MLFLSLASDKICTSFLCSTHTFQKSSRTNGKAVCRSVPTLTAAQSAGLLRRVTQTAVRPPLRASLGKEHMYVIISILFTMWFICVVQGGVKLKALIGIVPCEVSCLRDIL